MKYIFFDIDGTLLDKEEGIADSTVKALALAKDKGNKIFINTGRSFAELGTSFRKFNFDGFVCAAGSYIKIADDLIFDKEIDRKEVLNLTDLLDELRINYGLEGESFTYFTDPVYEGYRERIYEAIEGVLDYEPSGYEPYHYAIQPAYVRKIKDYLEAPTKINKFLLYAKDAKDLDRLEKCLPEGFDLIKYGTFAELINKGINKATGIDLVMDYFGADLKDSVAIGDSLNDLDMLRHAGIGVAMGNSVKAVKDAADFVTDHIQEDGIYKAMEKLDLI